MRVLLTTPDYPPASGGIQILCQRLAERSRHTYAVVTLGSAGPDQPRGGGPKVTRLTTLREHRLSIVSLNAATIARALTWRPDAIVSGHIVTGLAGLQLQHVCRAPLVQYLYSKEFRSRPQLTRLITRRAAATIAVSSYSRTQAIAVGAPPERVRVIHPGVDPREETAIADTAAPDGPPTVVTVARLEDRYKGFDVMIAALPLIRAKVPEVRWVVIGSGPLRDELEARARSLGVSDSVIFAGRVSDAERDGWLKKAQVFAMPSRLEAGGTGGEGFGIVFLEAGAYGLPCVAGDRGGGAEAVVDGETGITVDPTDHVAVAEGISILLRDRDLRARYGEAARERCQRFSWQRMADQVDDLVVRLVDSRSGPSESLRLSAAAR